MCAVSIRLKNEKTIHLNSANVASAMMQRASLHLPFNRLELNFEKLNPIPFAFLPLPRNGAG